MWRGLQPAMGEGGIALDHPADGGLKPAPHFRAAAQPSARAWEYGALQPAPHFWGGMSRLATASRAVFRTSGSACTINGIASACVPFGTLL